MRKVVSREHAAWAAHCLKEGTMVVGVLKGIKKKWIRGGADATIAYKMMCQFIVR